MSWQEHITIDPKVLTGKPIVKGTRLSVEFIIDLLAQGWSETEILQNYPGLTKENIHACLSYASVVLRAEKVYSLEVWDVRLLADENFLGNALIAKHGL